MNYAQLQIEYEDGTTETVLSDQRDRQAFDLWALKRGYLAPVGRDLPNVIPVVFFRVCAWSAYQRANGPVEYKEWDAKVVRVELVEEIAVDPTQPGTPDGSSESSPSEPG
jgi:hypothetical protein